MNQIPQTRRETDAGERVVGLLTQQELLYRQLKELALKQTELVNGQNPEMLLKVLAARQRLIDRLTEIDRQLRPIRQEWGAISARLSPEQRRQTQRLVDSVQQILAEILDRDEKDFNVLNTQKQQVAGEIRATVSGRRMNQAYGQHAPIDRSRYVDTQSG